MRYIVIASCCLAVLFLFLLKKKKLGKIFEYFALFWFKVVVAVIVLFVGNMILNSYGLMVPINVFSILTLTILGVPGAVCLSFLLFLK